MTELPDALVRITQALLVDEDLALWFETVMEAKPKAREIEFRQMAARMRNSGADRDLTHAVGLLAIPGISESVLAAFHELRGD